VLLVHVSNRFLDLEPVVAAIAKEMGLSARQRFYQPDEEGRAESYNASIWIALTANEDAMVRFTEATGQGGDWVPIAPRAGVPAWTDGFASILPVLKPFWERF
jgi:hypothetical protein